MAMQQQDGEILKSRLSVPINAQFMEISESRFGGPGWKQVCVFIFGLFYAFATHLRAETTTELSFDGDPNRLLQADGTTLPDRSVILFGSFTNATNDPLSLVRSLPSPTASNILTTLRSNFVVWRLLNYTNGQDLFQNTTTPGAAARNNLAGRPVYLWVYNSTNTNATNADNLQFGIFRARGTQVFPDATETEYFVGLTLNNNPITDSFPGTGILFGRYVTNGGAQSFRLAPVTNVESSTMGTNTNFSVFSDVPFEIDVTANNGPTDFTLDPTNLPGLSFTNHGTLTGQFNLPTNVVVTVVASNNEGWGVQAVTHRLNFTVNPLTLAASNSQSPVAGVTLNTNASQVFSSPGGAWTSLTALPAGLALAADGSLTGTVWSTNARFTILRQIVDSTTNIYRLNFSPSTPVIRLGGLVGGHFRVRQGQAATNTNLTFSAGFQPDVVTPVVPENLNRLQFTATTNGLTVAATNPLVAPLSLSATIPSVTLSASKTDGTNSLEISTSVPVVVEAPAPSFTSPGTNRLTLVVGQPYPTNLTFLFQTDLDSKQWRPTFTALNLPAGLTISGNGNIGGSPTNRSLLWRATSSITAANTSQYHGGGTSTFSVQFKLENEPPVLTAPGLTNFGATGRPLNWSLSWANGPTNVSTSGIPPGCEGVLSSDGTYFTIRGVPTVARKYDIYLAGENADEPGGTTRQSSGSNMVVLFVAGSRPSAGTTFSTPENLQIGRPLPPGGAAFVDTSAGVKVSVYGLPTGLSLDSSTGRLSGTPTARGTFTATVFIQNGRGWIKKSVTLTVR
jgi:hypothetical protein